MNKSEGKGGMRYVCSVFRGLRYVVSIAEISLFKYVELSGKDKGKCLCCGACCSGVAGVTDARGELGRGWGGGGWWVILCGWGWSGCVHNMGPTNCLRVLIEEGKENA